MEGELEGGRNERWGEGRWIRGILRQEELRVSLLWMAAHRTREEPVVQTRAVQVQQIERDVHAHRQ
jgi:hypothetical protein